MAFPLRSPSYSSRRGFLLQGGAAASAALLPSFVGTRDASAQPGGGPTLVYVSCYSNPRGPEGSHGNGKGIACFAMNAATGSLQVRQVYDDPDNPSWLALHPSKKFLYAGNEVGTFGPNKSGSVSALAIGADGSLQLLNTVSAQGAGPAYISVHPSGKFLFVANYAGGTIAVLPIGADGQLQDASDVKTDAGTPGAKNAASAPPGSFAISGHDKPHAHTIIPDPSGRFVLSTDLALDVILVWKFDAHSGTLTAADTPSVSLPSGDGPRHLVFHPNGRILYSLQEEGSTIVQFTYDANTGRLQTGRTVSSLPKGFAGTNFTSEIAIAPGGKHLYAANRLHDSIAVFAIGSDGALQFLADEPTRGDYPRSFTIDPTGSFLYCCNQRSDAVAIFKINKRTGGLSFTGQYVPLGTPAMVLFLS